MAAARRISTSVVTELLRRDPAAFSFVQAVRLLRLAARQDGDAPGHDTDDLGPVRLRASTTLSFPLGEVESVETGGADGDITTLTVPFMGVTGPAGVLPQIYTQWLNEETTRHHTAMRDFLDLFHNRLLQHFYRASIKYRPLLRHEAGGHDLDDPFSRIVLALTGMLGPGLHGRLPLDDRLFLFHAGHFSRSPRSAVALELLLSASFAAPVRVEQFQGRWQTIARQEQSRLPAPDQPQGQFCVLGRSVAIGERCWEMQGGVTITLGPVSGEEFQRFLPHGGQSRRLFALARSFCGPGFDLSLRVIVAASDIPPLTLGGGETPPDTAPRLGWSTWTPGGQPAPWRDEAHFHEWSADRIIPVS